MSRIPLARWCARLVALLFGAALALAAGEVALRASGAYSTYSERNFGTYKELYGRSQEGWLRVWEPSKPYRYASSEFLYVYDVNADGVRDVEHALAPEPGRARVVVLGDSYAEGVGADRHEAWPARMGELLEHSGTPVEVFNAGVAGSDPCFEVQLLRQRFLRYRPDLVVVALNQSDLDDVTWWGGMERFHDDGTTRGRPRPRGLGAYRHSHLARWFLHTVAGLDRRTFTYDLPARVAWDAQLAIVESLQVLADLGERHGFDLLVLVHPVPRMLDRQQLGFFQAFFDTLHERGIEVRDLSQPLIDALAGMRYEEFAWPVDSHFNARGYAVMAELVAPLVQARLNEPHLAVEAR